MYADLHDRADRADHSSAAFLCFGSLLHSGVTMALSRKFSASKFFDEVREGNASVIQYIGESASAVVWAELTMQSRAT